MSYDSVIGLEVHVQLNTQSKLFSNAATTYGATPNSQANILDLGLPGTLPVINQAVIDKAIVLGLALQAKIAQSSVFARKNYFYPDLPKGYQISQYDRPIIYDGTLTFLLNGAEKSIRIARAHLEEDAGKSIHDAITGYTALDFNRAGTPLLEVVTEPDLCSAQEAVAYLKTLHTLVRFLDICDGNMQEGSFRCDANVSVRPDPSAPLGTRVELKNINSFRFVEQAIELEIARQIALLKKGDSVVQETRLYDPDQHETRPMRSKEDAHDYRYFSDPDLLPLQIRDEQIALVRAQLPELPYAKAQRYQTQLGLSLENATALSQDRACATFFEAVIAEHNHLAKTACNWIQGEITRLLRANDCSFSTLPIHAKQLSDLLQHLQQQTLSNTLAKKVLQNLWDEPTKSVDDIIKEQGLETIHDSSELDAIIDQIIQDNPKQTAQFRAGKHKVLSFFMGQVMKQTQGKADPKTVNTLLSKALSEHD